MTVGQSDFYQYSLQLFQSCVHKQCFVHRLFLIFSKMCCLEEQVPKLTT